MMAAARATARVSRGTSKAALRQLLRSRRRSQVISSSPLWRRRQCGDLLAGLPLASTNRGVDLSTEIPATGLLPAQSRSQRVGGKPRSSTSGKANLDRPISASRASSSLTSSCWRRLPKREAPRRYAAEIVESPDLIGDPDFFACEANAKAVIAGESAAPRHAVRHAVAVQSRRCRARQRQRASARCSISATPSPLRGTPATTANSSRQKPSRRQPPRRSRCPPRQHRQSRPASERLRTAMKTPASSRSSASSLALPPQA